MTDFKALSTTLLDSSDNHAPTDIAQEKLKLALIDNNLSELSASLKGVVDHIQDNKGKKYYVQANGDLTDTDTNEEKKKSKSIRVFTKPPEPSPLDLYQRGLQFGRAALIVIENQPGFNTDTYDATAFQQITNTYSEQMSTIYAIAKDGDTDKQKLAQYKAAAELTHLYLGALSHLVRPDDPKKGHADITKAADMLMMLEPNEDIICTMVPPEDASSVNTLQFSERINPTPKETGEAPDAETTGWYKFNIEKHGDWFKKFITDNWNVLKNKPVPSTARDLPQAANAWDEVTVTTKANGSDYHESHSGRIGITTPFSFKGKHNTEDRIKHAADASVSVLETQYQSMADRFIEQWGSLYGDDEEIEIPILHATYVAPMLGNIDQSFVNEKTAANEKVREELPTDKTSSGHRVKFQLLETNNCINIWRHVGYRAPRDRADSNELIGFANSLMLRASTKVEENEPLAKNMQIAMNYLNSATTLPPRFKGPSSKEKQAIDAVITALNKNKAKIGDLTPEAKSDLALILQSAVELKRLNHESAFAPARRWLNDLPTIGPILRPITFLTFAPFQIAGYVASLPGKIFESVTQRLPDPLPDGRTPTFLDKATFALRPFAGTMLGGRNKQTFKSAFEEILADKLGYSISGCKSALDRKGEVEVVKTAILKEHAELKQVPDYYDAKNYNAFFFKQIIPTENEGHQIRLASAADYVGERKMWETRPGQYVDATDHQKAIAKTGAAFRGPKSSKWEKIWEIDNPFKQLIADATTRSIQVPEKKSTADDVQTRDDLPDLGPPYIKPFISPSPGTPSSKDGLSIQLNGEQLLETFNTVQSLFSKNESISSKLSHIGKHEKGKDSDKTHYQAYIFNEDIPTLNIERTDSHVRMKMVQAPDKESEIVEILALQIKLMTDNGMDAEIKSGPDELRTKICNRCVELGVERDKISLPGIPEKSIDPPLSSINRRNST